VTTVKVIAGKPSEFRFVVAKKTLPTGAVTFSMTNGGTIPHDFKICASPNGGLANSCAGKGTALISPGGSTSLTYTFKSKGTYEYLCTVPGHAAAGMKGDLKVT
jgi:nitrite reductase (NO-forming)